jgi:hypothetical protein
LAKKAPFARIPLYIIRNKLFLLEEFMKKAVALLILSCVFLIAGCAAPKGININTRTVSSVKYVTTDLPEQAEIDLEILSSKPIQYHYDVYSKEFSISSITIEQAEPVDKKVTFRGVPISVMSKDKDYAVPATASDSMRVMTYLDYTYKSGSRKMELMGKEYNAEKRYGVVYWSKDGYDECSAALITNQGNIFLVTIASKKMGGEVVAWAKRAIESLKTKSND